MGGGEGVSQGWHRMKVVVRRSLVKVKVTVTESWWQRSSPRRERRVWTLTLTGPPVTLPGDARDVGTSLAWRAVELGGGGGGGGGCKERRNYSKGIECSCCLCLK